MQFHRFYQLSSETLKHGGGCLVGGSPHVCFEPEHFDIHQLHHKQPDGFSTADDGRVYSSGFSVAVLSPFDVLELLEVFIFQLRTVLFEFCQARGYFRVVPDLMEVVVEVVGDHDSHHLIVLAFDVDLG